MLKPFLHGTLSALVAGTLLLSGCGSAGTQTATANNGSWVDALSGKKPAPARKTTRSGNSGFTPAWVKDAVFYQIFPERFQNGDTSNDPTGSEPWGGVPQNGNFFGGDLAGVSQKLSYLQSLGINSIYFNPLFKSNSNHKYNTTDYMQIDPHFGTNAQFKELISECHRRGMRVIIDGVFNHTGDENVWFQDAKQKGQSSKFWNFYNIHSFPVVETPAPNYDAWWGFSTLPKLRVADNPAVQAELYNVVDYWTKQGVDGWRLDVPNEIASDSFWQGFRKHVRAINPNAYIVGEIWTDGSHWVQGDQFDAVMNYMYRQEVLNFFAYQNTSVDDLDARLADLRAKYGDEVTQAEFNILGSHDVPRLLTESGGDASRVKEAVFFQMVYPGAPVVYYGDELGMAGAKDPDNRRCMPWNTVQGNQTMAFYQRMIALRKAHPALRGAGFRTLMRHNDFRLFSFVRSDANEKVVVAMNSGHSPRDMALVVGTDFADGTAMVDYVSGRHFTVQNGTLAITGLEPSTGMVLGVAGSQAAMPRKR
jgi:cyclomaltodextrinase